MTEPDKMDEYKTKMPYGSRFGYRTPPPEFVKSYVEPLSPLLGPAMPSASRNDDIPPLQQLPNTLPPPPTAAATLPPAPAPARQSLFSSYPTASRYNVNSTPVDYGAMDPMQMFADIALSTAPPSFIASWSQSVSHAPTASPSALRSSSIPSSLSNPSGVLPAAWSADGYPTRNGKYTPAYPPQSLPPHAINSDGFHTGYPFERRTSATRLEPPIKSPVMTKTPGDSFFHSSPPLGLAASPRSQQLSFSPTTAGYRPERSGKRRPRRDAKENVTPNDAEDGKGAGSSRDGRGSRSNNARGRGAASNRQSSRKSRARALSPIKDLTELEKPPLVKPKPKPTENKVSGVLVVNGTGLQTSPIRLNRITASAIGPNDPPSPSPAYSPFPSRHTSPVNEAIYITPPVSGEVDRASESLPKMSVPEDVPIAQEPENKPEAQGIIVEPAVQDVAMEDVEPTVVEVLVDGNSRIADEAPGSLEVVVIFSKHQESPDSGVIDSEKEQTEPLDRGISPTEDATVRQNITQGSEIFSHKDKAPVIEPPTDGINALSQPIVADSMTALKEESIEDLTEDISMVGVQAIEEAEQGIPIKENEDFEFAQAVGNEPIFGAGDALNNGLPLGAFDATQEPESGTVTATGFQGTVEEPRQLPILSPSGELSREPGDPDNEICGECDTKYRDSYGFRLDQVAWIGCDGCGKWYHSHCLNLDDTTVKRIDKFYCAPCEPTYGKSTMKRTSTRATTAIDYNALHNGSSAPIKNPNDSKLHPYVAIIRDRTHTFAADNLPRLRPDQVTVEFIDDMSTGWNQPFVVPATENPAPWIELSEDDKLESEKPRSEQDYLNMSMTPEASPSTPGLPESTLAQFPPAPPRSSRTTNDEPKGSKKSKGNTPEMTLDNGDFDQTEVNRIKKTLVEGEYDVKERRPGADCLDMIIPEGLTVRMVGELIGAQMRVEMINVLRQSTTREDKWQMEDLVQYFESKDRTEIYNCISCEVTNTPLGTMISRPEVVRKLDLSDKVWRPSNDNDVKPHVGKYVLMSVADSFTDFHIDFAGSSVFYHIYEGQKVFLVLPPTGRNLEIYEQWSMNPDMNTTFFPRLCDDPCMLVTLNKGDTLFIPSGWIHAVYTPKDSLVIGGNFLTRNHYTKQMAIQKIEVVTDTKISQRYPKYTTLMWHTLHYYLTNDPIPGEIDKALTHGRVLRQKTTRVQKGRPAYTRQELEGLPDLCNFLLRTALIHCGSVKTSLRPGRPCLTFRQIEAVKRAIPTPCNENPLKWIKKFGRWCIWKRAALKMEPVGERVPEWAQGKWIPEETVKKGPSKAELKRVERLKLEEARRAEAPRREGLRVRNMRTSTTPGESESNEEISSSKPSTPKPTKKLKRKGEGEIEPANKKRGRPNKTSLKIFTGPKKVNSEDSAAKSKRKGKGKGNHTTDGGDGEAFTLSDGSIYVAKESNLGPARAGCQNCRMKKTGCKHKAEIAELVAKLEANGGVLPEIDNKGKGRAKAVQQELEDEEEEEEEEEGEEREEEEGEEREEGEEANGVVLDKGKGKQESIDEDLDMAVLEDEREEEEEDRAIPTWAKESSRRSSGASSSKSQKRAILVGDEDDKDQTPPKKVKAIREVLATPAQFLSGVAGRPPGFQGRKPSCEECKALKTKCHHDTWHLAKVKTPAKSVRSGPRRKSAATSIRTSAPRRSIGNDTGHSFKPAKDARRSSSGDAEDKIKDDEQEELEDVIVCKKPMIVTSAVKATAPATVQYGTQSTGAPALSSIIVASGTPSTPAKHSPPVAGSSANTSPLTENEFDLDLSVLDEQLPYKSRSRSSNTPDDPTIMAPPVDFDDEPTSTVVPPTVANGVAPVTTTNTISNSTLVANYPIPAYRVHKPKVTYTRNNKNFKKKADKGEAIAMEGMTETDNNNNFKQIRVGTSMSPGAERRISRGASVNGSVDVLEEGDISVEELKRLGTAADFGLRRRAGS